MSTFLTWYFGTIISPGRNMEAAITSPKGLRRVFVSVGIMALVYTLVYLFLVMGDGRPFKPWLAIPPELYYRYNVFFCAPSMFLGWILASGVAQLLCRTVNPNATFEHTLMIIGTGVAIASWATGLHDLITSFLGGVHVINQQEYEVQLNSDTIWRTLLWIQMIAYCIWFIALFSIGFARVYKLNILSSATIGIISFVIYQMFFFIFNR